MIFERFYLDCLSHASYLIGDERTGNAVVVDPQRDVGLYLETARRRGLTIRHAILTHFHADFVAGHIELRDACGATIHLGARARAGFAFHPLHDGDEIVLGDVRLKTLETPGHTPEGISLLVFDDAVDRTEPVSVLTGDTLFLGDVGRPDLLASIGVTAPELAEMLYDSLHGKLLALPDHVQVRPAHGAGSMCGRQLSDAAVSTIGEQRRFNYALQPMSKADFVAMITADQPEAPAYFVHDAILNREERPTLDESLKRGLRELPLHEVLALRDAGAQLVDVRSAADFAGAHLAGSLNIGLEGRYATWAGSVLRKDRPIVVIAEPEQVEEATMRLGRIGFDQVVGHLQDGLAALADRPDLVARTERITARALAELDPPPTVVDVRSPKEWAAGHVPGSLNVPLPHLVERLGELPATGRLVVHCQGGYRSSLAASLLERAGRKDVLDLVGGWKAWTASDLPAVEESPAEAPTGTCAVPTSPGTSCALPAARV